MFNIFLRGHLLTKKFFTFLVGSTFFTNKQKLHYQDYKESHTIKLDSKLNELKSCGEYSKPLSDENFIVPFLPFPNNLNTIDYKFCINFLIKNFGISIDYILSYLTIFRKLSIMNCEIPQKRKPYLGCSIRANEENIPGMKIILIKSDSPAERAGLKVKDIILEIDGKPVRTINEYNAAIGMEANKKKIKVLRMESGKENHLIIEVEFSYSD